MAVPADLSPSELSRLANLNEAQAYESLVVGAALEGFRARRDGPMTLLRASAAPSMVLFNRVIGWGLGEPAGVDSLGGLVAAYGDAGFGIELAAPAATPEIVQALRAQRFRRVAAANVLARDARDPPARYRSWAKGTGLQVERALPHQVDEMFALLARTFNVPQPARALLVRGTAGATWRRWVALDCEQVVGGSLSHVHEGVAWFGWTAVQPSHRGRWVPTGILARQLEEAAEAGCRHVTTETAAGTSARPDAAYLNVKRFGFGDCGVRWSYVRAPVKAKA